MVYDIINEFYGETPVVLCTGDSFVVCANPAASAKLRHIAEGERLFDHMRALDILKYRAYADSTEPTEPLVIEIGGYYGYACACVVFDRIMGRRFAAVSLFRNGEDAVPPKKLRSDSAASARSRDVSAFLSVLAGLPVSMFDGDDRVGLFDLREATAKCINDIVSKSRNIDCSVTVDENGEMSEYACFPVSVGLPNFMKMLVALLHVANDLSHSGNIHVRLCRYGGEGELRFTADTTRLTSVSGGIDAIMEEVPSVSVYLAACEYIAGCSGCSLDVSVSDCAHCVTLILTFDEESSAGIDFKSRDQFGKYDSLLRETLTAYEKLFDSEGER